MKFAAFPSVFRLIAIGMHLLAIMTATALSLPAEAPGVVGLGLRELEGRSGTKLTQAEAAARLKGAGITTVSSGNCTDKNKPTCTSLDGILSGTIDGVINLKKQSGASIVITGGTETGHAKGARSHANGFKVDVQKGATIDNFIKKTFKQIANRGDGFPQWQDTAKNTYCDEKSHWDITFV